MQFSKVPIVDVALINFLNFDTHGLLSPFGATRLTSFLQARSSRFLQVSFELSHVHSFSGPYGHVICRSLQVSLQLSHVHSFSGPLVISLPPSLTPAQPCPFFLQAIWSCRFLQVSFELSHIHSFSRPYGHVAPSKSHSSSAMSILSPGHMVISLPPSLIPAQPCPFFLQAIWSSRSLQVSFQLSHVHSFSRPYGHLTPSKSHSSSAMSILSPGHMVISLPPSLIPAQPCPFFQAIWSSHSLQVSFQLSHVHSFSRPYGHLTPSKSHSSSAMSILSPGHMVISLPPSLIPAQPCPFFLQAIWSSHSLQVSFQLSHVHSFPRPYGHLTPSKSHSSSAMSILSPGHMVISLPPSLIRAQPCPFFLRAIWSCRSLQVSFQLSHVHSFSRPYGHLAPSKSHSSSAMSILSPGHMVISLPPSLIPAQPCPFFLQAIWSCRSLQVSFQLSHVHSFSRPYGHLAPSKSHSSSAMSILSPGHMVISLPPSLIRAQPCPFFLRAIWSCRSLQVSFQLSHVHSFSRPYGHLAPSKSHSSSAMSILSPGHMVISLPPSLIPAQPCPFFLQAIWSCRSLQVSFQLSHVHSFSRPYGHLAPSKSHSSSAMSILSPGHMVMSLPPSLIPAQPCPFFPQAIWSCRFFQVSFQLSHVHSFSRPYGHLAPSKSHSSSAMSILSPGHMVISLPPSLIRAQPCPFFLQAIWSCRSLQVSFELSHVHSFSRPYGHVAPSKSHSSSAMSILSPGHMVISLPPSLIPAQPCPFFLQAIWSCRSLQVSFQLSHVHSFSRPYGHLAPSKSHSSSAMSILSPGHMVISLPPSLIPAQPCPFFLRAIWSSRSLQVSFQLSHVHSFSRPYGHVAPSKSHSSSAMSILSPGHMVMSLPPSLIPAQPCPFFLQAIWSCRSLQVSFQLSHVHSFSRPYGHLAPSKSHSSSAMSILSPGHMVMSLLPSLIPAQPCPFFLRAIWSCRSLQVSFQLSHVHSFSRP